MMEVLANKPCSLIRKADPMDEKKQLNSLSRGLEALSILAVKDRLTGSELARRLKLPRTTAHRILETLAHEGYVLHDVANRCFRLSAKVRHIAFGFNRDSLLADIARPVLQALCQQTLMPVGLTTPVGARIVTQVSTDYDAPLALERVKEGASFPLTLGASGHIFLAHCSRPVRTRLLEATQETVKFPPPSDEDLDRIREQGFAISPPREGWVEGLIAVPIYFNGDYVAGIHLRFMRRVMTEGNVLRLLLPQLRTAALEIETLLSSKAIENPGLYENLSSPLLVSANDSPAIDQDRIS